MGKWVIVMAKNNKPSIMYTTGAKRKATKIAETYERLGYRVCGIYGLDDYIGRMRDLIGDCLGGDRDGDG